MRRYKKLIEEDVDLCLGSYCFCGAKSKNLPQLGMVCFCDGEPTEAIDFMSYCWKGNWPDSRAPSINGIKLDETNWKKDHFLNLILKLLWRLNMMSLTTQKYIDYKLYPEAFTNKIGEISKTQ